MRKVKIIVEKKIAGILTEKNDKYQFQYKEGYNGSPVSLTMPVGIDPYYFENFPPFFDGLLPEGVQLEGLLKFQKIDRYDYLSQLIAVGHDLVGAVTVECFHE